MLTFHFFTLVTKTDQYEAMRASLEKVGFDGTNSVFTVLDNRDGNAHEPYSAITKAVQTAQAPYVVFCHQDLIFYHGPEALLEEIRRVEARDPQWAVIGNSGARTNFTGAVCIDDINGSHDSGEFPVMVLSLDEDLLVIRRDSGVGCSAELSGFHLYGTDICLNAYLKGGSAWVFEYRLEHLGTTLDFDAVHRLAPHFYRKWRRYLRGAVVFTPPMVFVFSGVPLLFRAINRKGLNVFFHARFRTMRTVDYLLRYGRPQWLPYALYLDEDPRGPRMTKATRLIDAVVRRGRPRWPADQRFDVVGREDLERFYQSIRDKEERLRREAADSTPA